MGYNRPSPHLVPDLKPTDHIWDVLEQLSHIMPFVYSTFSNLCHKKWWQFRYSQGVTNEVACDCSGSSKYLIQGGCKVPAQIKLMDYITWPPVTHSKSKCKSNFSQGVANFSFNWAETFQIQMLQQIKQKQQPVYFYWVCWWANDISIEHGRFLFTNEMKMLFEKIHLA